MTPRDRIPADQSSDVATEARPRERTNAAARELNSAHAAVLAVQQGAGNQAVAGVLGGGVQRAPNEPDMVPVTAVTGGGEVDSDGRSTGNPMARPDQVPARGGVTGGGDVDSDGRSTGNPMAPPAKQSPGGPAAPAWDPKMAGGVPKVEERRWHRAQPATESDASIQYQLDPSTVIRSRDRHWHWQMWNASKGTEKYGMAAPMVIRAGSLIIVHPNYQGPATDLPNYKGNNTGLGPPIGPGGQAPGSPAPGTRPNTGPPTPDGERPLARMPQDPTEARQRQAVAPFIPVKGAWGSQVAYRVSYQEAADYAAKNPGKVFRNETETRHTQGWVTDGGKGGTPGAYRIGDQIYISRGYPIDNVPFLTMPGSIGPGANAGPKGDTAKATQNVTPGATTYAEGGALGSRQMITSEGGGRTETRTRSREQAVVTTTTEVTENGMNNKTERKAGAAIGMGGNIVGATVGQTDTSKIEGDVVAAKRQRQVNAGLGTDMKATLEAKSSKEIVTGTDPEGNPIKQSSQSKAGAKADFSGWEAGGSHDRTSTKGNTMGAGAKLKGDWKGNVELEAFINIQSKGGISFKPTVSHGVKVEASEPIEGPDGYEVVYKIIETSGVGAGGGKQFGGGANVGVNVGATHGEFQGGRRSFKTKDEANAFRDNAAARVMSEQSLTNVIPPTSVAGALQIPVGETRSSGDISGKSIGGSAGYSGVAINVGTSKSTTNEMAIKRTGKTVVEVTGSVTGSKTGSVGITAPALGHGYSSTDTTSFAVTFEFDLSKEQGRAAFELYCRTGIPPMQRPKWIEKGGSQADNETFSIAGLGQVVWTGTTWQMSREGADGSLQSVHGGAQIHEQTPGTVGKWLGEDTLKSNAQIVRVDQDGQEVASRAQFKVSGTSGDYNKKEFGKIFSGARPNQDTKPSGEWTLTGNIPKENIDALAKNSSKIRNAIDEKQAYSELVKANGAQMLGGQMGGGSSMGWDLELKGDPNFPGEKERNRLRDVRTSLMARVRSNPELANDIVRETGEEIAKLTTRREAVADEKKYTDLPDQLRQQQLRVIDAHIDDMKVVRRTAQSIAMKRNIGERQSDVAARVEAAEKVGPGPKGGKRAGGAAPKKAVVVDEAAKADQEYAKLQDQVGAKESRIATKRNEVKVNSKALGDAIGAKGTTALKFGADSATAQVAIAAAKGYIGAATEADKKQAALDPEVERLRNAWSAAADRPAQLNAIRMLDKVLDERLKQLELCLFFIREAGKTVFHITTRGAKSGNPAFWGSLGETEGEE